MGREQATIRMVGSVERAITVLETLASGGRDLGTNEIARLTKINSSTVSRLLSTLASRGLVSQVPSGRYRIGARLLQLGQASLAGLDLRELARPHLLALVEATGETATLSVPGEQEAITIDFVQGESSVQSIARLGRPSVAHATAVGKVLLSYGFKPPPGKLRRYTPSTITRRSDLAGEIERAGQRGWAEASGEREEDLNAVAAPIVGPYGKLVGVLGIQGPAGRFKPTARRACLPLLLSAARVLSSELGGQPERPDASGEADGAAG
ncbi:MAG: IclR family transcriptional regulator [Actinomycetota bacterium]|nr:IclR family transcriptional regulator [Actinomycetota bacterium]